MADYPKSGQKDRTLSPAGGDFTSKGHSGHMFGFRGAGEQKPDQSAQEGTGGRRDQKANGGAAGVASSDESKHGKGDSKKAANRYGAGPQDPGCSSASGARQDGFAHGGKTAMFGNMGSKRAEPGKSSP
jgi:hypothetical protein